MIKWRGYEFTEHGIKKHYSITLPKEKMKQLHKQLKKWEGSQKEFYFTFVNPSRLVEI